MDTPQQPSPQLPAGYPVNVDAIHPEHPSRLWAVATLLIVPKMLLLIPHLVVMAILGFLVLPAMIIGQLAVLFTGRYPRALFDFVVAVYRWQMRVNAFCVGLTDQYPPFRLK
jgi:hypothetical protein